MDADVPLYSNIGFLLRALNKRNHNTGFPTASGSAASVLVRFPIFWGIVVDDAVDAFYIDSPCSDIRCNKRHAFAMLKPLHGHITAALAQSPVKGFNCKAVVDKVITNSVNSSPGSAEHDCPTTFTDDLRSDVRFL